MKGTYQMMFEAQSYASLGPVELGASREEVRQKVGELPVELARKTLRFPADFFKSAALQVEYGSDLRCISVQATSRRLVSFAGKQLSGMPFNAIRGWLEQLDPSVKVDGAGLTSEALGLSLY